MNRAGGARSSIGATPPGGSRLARRIPTLEDLRELLLKAHPECRRVQAGGCPRMLPIAQVLCDWATPQGQRVVAEYLEAAKDVGDPRNRWERLARYQAKRERIVAAVVGRRRELDELGLVARRAAMKDAMEAIASQWEAEDRAAAAAPGRKEVAA